MGKADNDVPLSDNPKRCPITCSQIPGDKICRSCGYIFFRTLVIPLARIYIWESSLDASRMFPGDKTRVTLYGLFVNPEISFHGSMCKPPPPNLTSCFSLLNRQFSYTPYERLHIAAETGDRAPVGAIYRTFFADIPIVVYFFTFYLTYIKSDESGRRNSSECVAPFTLTNGDTVRHSKLPHVHAKLFF